MKKVLFICNGLSIGGAERVVTLLANSLAKENKVYILSYLDSQKKYPLDENIKVIIGEPSVNKLNRIKEIRMIVKKEKIDTIIAFSHYHAMRAVIACIGLNVKIIGSERNDPAQLKNRKLINFARNILYRRLDCLVCQTKDAKEYFPKKIQRKAEVILNPISENLPKPYIGEREKKIVSFSRFEQQKNIPMLIEAFSKIHSKYPDYILELYGEGSEKNNIIKLVENKGLSDVVKICEFTQNIHEKVLKSSMFVLASNYEGLSNSMLEAMAIGIPTIVTDCPCGGARMVIKNRENGILVPVGNVDKLVENMKELIENKELALKLEQNSIKIREELAPNKIVKLWEKVINNE